jgi:glycogen(starch) synthase
VRVAVLAATCVPWHRYGGLERHVFDLCRWLRRRGVEVDLYTSSPEHDVDPFAGDAGFHHEIIPGIPFRRERFAVVISRNTLYPAFVLRMGARVVRRAAERSYAAVVAQGLTGFGYVAAAARAPHAPLILNPQGMEESLTPSALKRAAYLPFRQMTRYGARRAAAVVATDQVLRGAVERVLHVPADRVVVIPNGIDVAACLANVDAERASRIREEFVPAETAPLIVTVGRLAPNKGFEIALEALSRIGARLPPAWRWVWIGEGPMRRRFVDLVERSDVGGKIVLAGNRSDTEMHTLVACADLFLNPTLYEGSSLVTLEAMSHASAIVATRAGGIPDKIEEDVTGWIAEPGDPKSLAEAILRWQGASDAERSRIRAAAATRCRERFDWPVCVDRYLETIGRLANERLPPER